MNSDALPEFYLALKATEKIDLQINVNGEPSYYTYEQLSNPKQPVRILEWRISCGIHPHYPKQGSNSNRR